MNRTLGFALISLAVLAIQAQADTINFDNLGNLVSVTNQYAGVVFSSSGGDVILTTAQVPPYLGSAPNLICTGSGGTIDCTQDVILTFTSPVSSVSFDAFGNQTPFGQAFATVDVYQSGVLTHSDVPLEVSHTSHCAAQALDCASDPQSLIFANITELVIKPSASENRSAGTAYDNFTFSVASVPEPSTLLLLLTLLCGIGGARTRFREHKRV